MTQRERYLAIGIGAIATLFVGDMMYGSIRDGIKEKEAQVEKAESDLQKANGLIEAGKRAAVKLDRLVKKSLPRVPSIADAQYGAWLYELADQVSMEQESVTAGQVHPVYLPLVPNQRTPEEAYKVYEFTLSGKCRSEKLVDLLAQYYDRDYIHRIKSLTVTRDPKEKNLITIQLVSEAISLPKAAPEQEPPTGHSGRLTMSTEGYRKKILERNPFSPPNNGPKFETGRSHDIELGKNWSLPLVAKDPDGDRVTYEVVTEADKLPAGFTLRKGELNWQPTEKTTAEILVRATDEGWPHKSSEQKFSLKVVDPPKPKVQTTSAVDPASLAELSAALTNADDSVEGWINSKADGTTVVLHVGTELNIGSVEGTVKEINPSKSFVKFESKVNNEVKEWFFYMGDNLAEAYAKGIKD